MGCQSHLLRVVARWGFFEQSFLKGGTSRRWDAFCTPTIVKRRRLAPLSRLRRPNNFQEAALRAAEPLSAAKPFSNCGSPCQIVPYFCGASRRKSVCAKKIHNRILSDYAFLIIWAYMRILKWKWYFFSKNEESHLNMIPSFIYKPPLRTFPFESTNLKIKNYHMS